MTNHLTIGIYPSKDWVYNVVRELDLETHIEYNKSFRPGRLLYVDGKRVIDGCLKAEYLVEYDELEKSIRSSLLQNINMWTPTIPYR